jgi:adenylyltransferase/sulfurtransferase
MLLPGMGREGQQRLRAARVLVVGLGGLGSPAAMYLAAAGVGTLGLCDFDSVDLGNLHRQIVHSTPRIGMAKVRSAAETLAALNPHCRLVPHPEGLRAEDLPELFAAYDVVLSCADNFPTRYMAGDAAVIARRPLVHGSIFQYEGQVAVFHPAAGGPCQRCIFPQMPEPGGVPSCTTAGVIGPVCGIVGSMQAMEALKLIAGLGEPLVGRMLVIDSATMEPRTLRLKRDPTCPSCSAAAGFKTIDPHRYEWTCGGAANGAQCGMELSPAEVAALIKSSTPPLLIDVREPDECESGMIEGAVNIPLGQLTQSLAHLPRGQRIVAYCQVGVRSLKAALILRERGWADAASMSGGIVAWGGRD